MLGKKKLELKNIILKIDFPKSINGEGSKMKYDIIDDIIVTNNKAGNILLILRS